MPDEEAHGSFPKKWCEPAGGMKFDFTSFMMMLRLIVFCSDQ